MRLTSRDSLPPTATIAARLRSPVLRRLLQSQGERFAPHLEARTYEIGEMPCRLGIPPEGTWIVVDGEASLTRQGAEVDLPQTEARTPGGVFGVDGGAMRATLAVRAETRLSTLFLPEAALRGLVAANPDVAQAMAFFSELSARRGDVVRALRMAVCFRGLSSRRLLGLVEQVDRRAYAVGDTVVHQGDAPQGIFVVLEGQLHAWRTELARTDEGEITERRSLVDVYTPGEVFGDVATYEVSPEPLTVVATRDTVTAFLPLETYFSLISTSPAFRRRLGAGAVESAIAKGAADPEAVVLVGPDRETRGRAALTRLVAEALATQHGHRPLILHLDGPPGDTPRERDRVSDLTVPATVDGVHGAVLKWRSTFDPIFLASAPVATLAGLAPALGRLVHVAEDLYEPLGAVELAPIPIRHVVLLGGHGDPRGYPTRTVRLLTSPKELGRLDPDSVRLATVPAPIQRGAARLGRAITERMVGVALGGGGAWGFSHVALLRALAEGNPDVPVDMVAGASFGALVAAFYCAEGLPGLDRLVAEGGSATPMTNLSMVSSRAFQWWVDQKLSSRKLEDLEVPMFPVATDTAYGIEYIPRTGTVGHGARASGAMPPLFTPVLVGGSRIVDGGFINNVPASVLRNEGASFVVASNCIATLVGEEERRPRTPIGRFLRAFNPLERAQDVVRSSLVLFHTAGLRESMFADAVFTPNFTGFQFWNFGTGPETVQKTVTDPGFAPSIQRIKERWVAFSVDRG